MRIASVKPNDLAVVTNDAFILIGDAPAAQGLLPKGATMIDFIANYESLKARSRNGYNGGLKRAAVKAAVWGATLGAYIISSGRKCTHL
jgi:hypothetical protein